MNNRPLPRLTICHVELLLQERPLRIPEVVLSRRVDFPLGTAILHHSFFYGYYVKKVKKLTLDGAYSMFRRA
jgi:hypothetical protein